MDTDNTQDIIKARFKELPPEVQKAITSSDLTEKFEKLAKKYELRIDQSGSFQTETLLVMLGLEKPADYVNNLVKNAELGREAAQRLATDVNTEIIGSIRAILEDLTSKEDADDESDEAADNTDLEKAGGITVDPNRASADIVSGPTQQSSNTPATPISKTDTLNGLENPPAFVDRLLTGSMGSVTEKVVKTETIATSPTSPSMATTRASAPITTAAPSGPKVDPYREPVE